MNTLEKALYTRWVACFGSTKVKELADGLQAGRTVAEKSKAVVASSSEEELGALLLEGFDGYFHQTVYVRKSSKGKANTQITFPRSTFDRDPSSLYWYARSATFMPLLQFLSFYQCIEFYFPHYSRQETIARIKNILKDPVFDSAKDSSINMIVNATIEGHRPALLEERKQLAATLKHCVNAAELRDFLNQTEERKKYYTEAYGAISGKRILLSAGAPIVEQTADRIYDIRCKVVHTKNLDAGEGDDMILPFSTEESLLVDDVELIQFLARKVLVASSSALSL